MIYYIKYLSDGNPEVDLASDEQDAYRRGWEWLMENGEDQVMNDLRGAYPNNADIIAEAWAASQAKNYERAFTLIATLDGIWEHYNDDHVEVCCDKVPKPQPPPEEEGAIIYFNCTKTETYSHALSMKVPLAVAVLPEEDLLEWLDDQIGHSSDHVGDIHMILENKGFDGSSPLEFTDVRRAPKDDEWYREVHDHKIWKKDDK